MRIPPEPRPRPLPPWTNLGSPPGDGLQAVDLFSCSSEPRESNALIGRSRHVAFPRSISLGTTANTLGLPSGSRHLLGRRLPTLVHSGSHRQPEPVPALLAGQQRGRQVADEVVASIARGRRSVRTRGSPFRRLQLLLHCRACLPSSAFSARTPRLARVLRAAAPGRHHLIALPVVHATDCYVGYDPINTKGGYSKDADSGRL